jgi:iron-sulfur cluster assembly protein
MENGEECIMARPRPKPVTLTDRAADRVKNILERGGHNFVRVGVKNGGCAGMEYQMDYADEPGTLDERVEDKGVEILIDPKAVLFLLGSTIDYRTSELESRFVFENPNQVDACGCGESVTLVAAQD